MASLFILCVFQRAEINFHEAQFIKFNFYGFLLCFCVEIIFPLIKVI